MRLLVTLWPVAGTYNSIRCWLPNFGRQRLPCSRARADTAFVFKGQHAH